MHVGDPSGTGAIQAESPSRYRENLNSTTSPSAMT